jgi:DNA-binding transcriptional MerR regulator
MNKRIETFTAGQVVKLSGVPYAKLDYWVRSGILRPSVEQASGKGSDRTFSFRDVVARRSCSRGQVDLVRRVHQLQPTHPKAILACLRPRGL